MNSSNPLDKQTLTAIGLMSGTSMDGIDAALLETDGSRISVFGPRLGQPYDPEFRSRLAEVVADRAVAATVEQELTARHAAIVRTLLEDNGLSPADIDVIGFHGHTTSHEPERRRTTQIGDGAALARELGIDVVGQFRQQDVAAGGEGAPFAPLYHAALCQEMTHPIAVLNLGGVGNVTWINTGINETDGAADILAFDTGPANALIDDWVQRGTGALMDEDGRLAGAGAVKATALAQLMNNPYFDRLPPKSLDRDAFSVEAIEGCSVEDGAATLTAFTVETVGRAVDHLPVPPGRWIVSGGGRKNPVMLAMLQDRLGVSVEAAEAVGWDGDAIEAQAFAFLAVRSLKGLPLSVPGTTGVPRPMTGGTLYRS
ncbi:MAG: anhydro-N-acetylmuramic acid kinase [Proteobacteria bacterium]|nr:anhydro-N-acetylmuramic acid kinase [Pseudomonadota bacterium]